jgi:hypothetical protein
VVAVEGILAGGFAAAGGLVNRVGFFHGWGLLVGELGRLVLGCVKVGQQGWVFPWLGPSSG